RRLHHLFECLARLGRARVRQRRCSDGPTGTTRGFNRYTRRTLDGTLGSSRTSLSRTASLLSWHPVQQSGHRVPPNRSLSGRFDLHRVDESLPEILAEAAVPEGTAAHAHR